MNTHYILLGVILILLGTLNNGLSQCTNLNKYPLGQIIAPQEGDTTLISTFTYAGDFTNMGGFQIDFEYQIMSSNPTDFITVRGLSNAVLAFGTVPLTYKHVVQNDVTVHFNLSSPVCGLESVNRTTSITNIGANIPKVGINTSEPLSTLDVNGMIKLGSDPSKPKAGMMRYNEETQDFEGFDGVKWKSLTTAQGQWGNIQNPEVTETSKFVLANGNSDDKFGEQIDHDGERLAVSAPYVEVNGHTSQGRIYIYEKEGEEYLLVDSIDDPNGRQMGRFGNGRIVCKGDYLMVGSEYNIFDNGSSRGSATIFRKSGANWISESVFTESADGTRKISGRTVDIYPPYALATSTFDGDYEVYIYKKTGGVWNEIQTITNPWLNGHNSFGYYAIIEDDRLFIVDAHVKDHNGRTGIIYYYENDGQDNYQLIDSILPNITDPDILVYGRRFNVDGDYLVVGDYGENYGSTTEIGAVDVHHYENSEWHLETTIRPPQGSDAVFFGWDVDILGNEIIIGSTTNSYNQIKIPKAFVYEKINSEWTNTNVLQPSDPQTLSGFGYKVVVGSNVIFIGDQNDSIQENYQQGSVYMYKK